MSGKPKPPNSEEAEREVLSAMLVDPDCIADVRVILKPEDFYWARHQKHYAAIVALEDRGVAVDVVTLREELHRQGTYESAGGARGLGELLDRCGTVSNVAHYARIVASKAVQRRIDEQAAAIQAGVASGDSSGAAALVAKLNELVADQTAERPKPWATVVGKTVDTVLDTATPTGQLRLGIGPADEHVGGIGGTMGSEFVVLYGPPEGAKTATMLGNVIAANSGEDNVPGAFFSLEMRAMQLALRGLALESAVPTRAMRQRDLTAPQVSDFVLGADRLAAWPLHVDDRMLTADQIYAECVVLSRKGCRYVVIDNLSEVNNGLETDVANEAHTVRMCVNVVRTLGMTVFLLAHTSVEGNRTGQSHKAAFVRGTSRTIGSADLALTILRGARDRNAIGLHIGKGRNVGARTWHPEDDGANMACGWKFDPVRLKVVT